MGTEKVVIDTNILISAIGWNGKPRTLFLKILNRELELVMSKKQLAELKRVLDYPKLEFTQKQKENCLGIINSIATIVETRIRINAVKEDPTDNMHLECAFETGTKAIVTGDRHLRKLKQYRGIRIVTVDEFLKNHLRLE